MFSAFVLPGALSAVNTNELAEDYLNTLILTSVSAFSPLLEIDHFCLTNIFDNSPKINH